jgi:hypothetical protein
MIFFLLRTNQLITQDTVRITFYEFNELVYRCPNPNARGESG